MWFFDWFGAIKLAHHHRHHDQPWPLCCKTPTKVAKLGAANNKHDNDRTLNQNNANLQLKTCCYCCFAIRLWCKDKTLSRIANSYSRLKRVLSLLWDKQICKVGFSFCFSDQKKITTYFIWFVCKMAPWFCFKDKKCQSILRQAIQMHANNVHVLLVQFALRNWPAKLQTQMLRCNAARGLAKPIVYCIKMAPFFALSDEMLF